VLLLALAWAPLAQAALFFEDSEYFILDTRRFTVQQTSSSDDANTSKPFVTFEIEWHGTIKSSVTEIQKSGEWTCKWALTPVIQRQIRLIDSAAKMDTTLADFLEIQSIEPINRLLQANAITVNDPPPDPECNKLQNKLDFDLVQVKDILNIAMHYQSRQDEIGLSNKFNDDKMWKLLTAEKEKPEATVVFQGGKRLDAEIASVYCLAYLSDELPTRTLKLHEPFLGGALRRAQIIYRRVVPVMTELLRVLNRDNPDVRFILKKRDSSTSEVADDHSKIDNCTVNKPDRPVEKIIYAAGANLIVPSLRMKSFLKWRKVEVPHDSDLASVVRDKNLYRNFDRYSGETLRLSENGVKLVQIKKRNPWFGEKTNPNNVSDIRVIFPADGVRTRVPEIIFSSDARSTDDVTATSLEKYRIGNVNAFKARLAHGSGVFFPTRPSFLAKSRTPSLAPEPVAAKPIEHLPSAGVIAAANSGQGQTNSDTCPDDRVFDILSMIQLNRKDLIVDSQRKTQGAYPFVGVYDTFPETVGDLKKEQDFALLVREYFNQGGLQYLTTAVRSLLVNQIAKNAKIGKIRAREIIKAVKELNYLPRALPLEAVHKEFHQNRVNDDVELVNDFTHGIKVATIIGARCNHFGNLGVSSGSTVLPFTDLLGLDVALDNLQIASGECEPSCVINISGHIGSGYTDKIFDSSLDLLISENEDSALFVTAAGDGASLGDGNGDRICSGGKGNHLKPACYPLTDNSRQLRRNLITVTSGERSEDGSPRLFTWANFGDKVEIAAPGGIVSLYDNDGNVSPEHGTSVSTAIVSGLAAEILSRAYGADPVAVRARILYSADLTWNFDGKVRYGWVDGRRSLDHVDRDVITLMSGERLVGELQSTIQPGTPHAKRRIYFYRAKAPGKMISSAPEDLVGGINGARRTPIFNNILRISLNDRTGLYDVVFFSPRKKTMIIERNVNYYADGERNTYCIKSSCRLDDGFRIRIDGSDTDRIVPLEHIKDFTASIRRIR